MKKSMLIILAAAFAVAACQEKPENPAGDPVKISLSEPQDNAAITAAADNDVTFGWAASGETGECELAFSLSKKMTSCVTIPAEEQSPMTLEGRVFMEKVISLGIEEGLPTKVYWTVRPVQDASAVETEVWSMTVTCSFPTISLNSPANLTVIDGNAPAFPYEFSFTPVSSVDSYRICFATSDKFPEGQTVSYSPDGSSWEMTEDRFYELMTDLGITSSETNIVYWTVIPEDDQAVVQTQTRSFTARRSALRNAVASWSFDDSGNLLKADVGSDMIQVGTASAIAGPGKGNGAISVSAGKENYLKAVHGIKPNGNTQKNKVNEYTILMDIRVAKAGWNALLHTDPDIGDTFGDGAVARLALSGDDNADNHSAPTYNGEMTGSYLISGNEWHRLILTSKCGNFWDVYVDGEYALDGNVVDYAQLDSDFALDPEGVLFCTDDNWIPSEQVDIAQITIWGEALDAGTIEALGGVPVY